MEAPAKHPPLYLQTLGWVICNMHAYDGELLNMHQVSSGLASCRRCNAVAVSANGLNALFT